MRFTYTRLLLLVALLIVAVLAFAATKSEGQTDLPEPPTLGVSNSNTVDNKCPRGIHSVKEYRKIANAIYRRKSVSRLATRKLRYMEKCQHSSWAKKMVERYHNRFKREREARQATEAAARAMAGLESTLAAIAQCESHGNPRAISPGGTYRGKYQFSFSTWASVGGSGDPAAASEAEQDKRAAILYKTGGPGHWPVCGR